MQARGQQLIGALGFLQRQLAQQRVIGLKMAFSPMLQAGQFAGSRQVAEFAPQASHFAQHPRPTQARDQAPHGQGADEFQGTTDHRDLAQQVGNEIYDFARHLGDRFENFADCSKKSHATIHLSSLNSSYSDLFRGSLESRNHTSKLEVERMSRHEGDTAPVQARPDGQFLQTSLELRVRYPSGRSQTYPIQRTPLRLGLDVPLEAGPQLELRLQAGRVVFQSLQADELVTHLGQSVQQGDWPVATSLEFCGHRILLWDRQRPATFLQCYTPPYAGELWPLEPGCYHLGRPGKRHNEIELDHPTVSREHATLRLGPQGLELTADYGNPVFVDGSQLPAGASVELKHGDFIEIGEVLFKLHQRAEPAAGALWVRSLGVFGVEVEGRPILEWGSRNARWLLARLAHAWGQPVATESLVDLLWPDMAPEKARNNLGFTLSLLRKILREHSPQTAIFRSSTSLELNSGFLKQHDYTELQSCLQRGQQARRESQVESMEKFFQQALALYQGAYLEDCYLDWASQVRLECEARVLEAGLELQRFYSAQGRQDELAAASLRQLGIDPCCQQSTLHLLRFHLNRGDSASMRRYFELHKAALARHLDSPPGPEVCELLALAPP